ncbi:MAG TPA: hypothetical protein VGC06_27195 [Actinomycetes bacterium]
MPVESEQAQTRRPVAAQPLEQEQAARPTAAPRPPHDEHELPDGRYLLAYRRASDA